MLKEKIREIAERIHVDAIADRRHLHRYPELSFQEFNTSEYIQKRLNEIGVAYKVIGDTGVLAWIEGEMAKSDRAIALRADIDALPIQEENNVEYKSEVSGVMHACGHDVHTSSLLATATIVNELRSEFSGMVKFIFQPGEEDVPGGAINMIEQGVLRDPEPSFILGQHTMPELEAGKIGIRGGNYMAAKDEIFIKIIGKGGHAAQPHLLIDPISIGAQLVTSLQQIISRNSDALKPAVLSFGRFIGNGSNNIIPNEVIIEGSFRSLDENWRLAMHERIKNMTHSIVESMGARCVIEIKKGYPVLYNDEGLATLVRKIAGDMLGEENVVEMDLWTASDDFAYYSQMVPGVYYRLGVGNKEKGITSGLHTSKFDADDESLLTGPELMTYLAISLLNKWD